MIKFYVTYSTGKYDGLSETMFDTIGQVVSFLNENAENPDFTFKVVEGHLVAFEPTVTIKSYRKCR